MAGGAADHDHHHPPARPLARLREVLRPERRDVTTVIVFAAAVAVLSLATPIAVESLVNTVAFGILMWPVLVLAGVLFGCLGLAAAIRAMQVYVVECLQRRLYVRVTADYAYRLPRVRIDALDGIHGPELANRFFDVMTVQKCLAILLLDGVAIVVTAVVGMIVLAFYHPFLLGFDILLVLLIGFLLFVLGIGGVRTSLAESHAKYDTASWLEELLRRPRAYRFAAGRELAVGTADRLASEYIAARREHFKVVWRQTLFALGLQVVASTTLLGLGGWLVINRQLTLGQLVAAELIVALVVASLAKIGKYTETYYDLMAGVEKISLPTDLPLERSGGEALPEADHGMAVLADGIGRVEPNARLAMIGPPGSGKTFLLETLCGLREPRGRTIELDGIDVRGLDPVRLREQVALVSGSDVFLGTVAENVRAARSHFTPAEVRAALQAVGLYDAVRRLPHGIDTRVTPDAGPLSAGQTRLLTLARAVVGRPRLLLLDGTLDRMDLRHCGPLLAHLFDRSAPWTLLVSTVRPDVARLCDRIIDFGPLPTDTPLPLVPAEESHP